MVTRIFPTNIIYERADIKLKIKRFQIYLNNKNKLNCKSYQNYKKISNLLRNHKIFLYLKKF